MSDAIQAVPAARKAGPGDVPALADVLAAAFFDDPVFSWCFPDPERRRRTLPTFFRTMVGACLPREESYLAEGTVAGAVSLPPGEEADEEQLAGLEELAGEDAPRLFQIVELTDAVHPTEPHHYLFFLGTRPEWQSRGIGSALLRHVLEPWERDGVSSYLEASSEDNKRLYMRHGYEVTDEIRLPGGPSLWPMWRAA